MHDVKRCEHCNHENEPGYQVCENCGFDISCTIPTPAGAAQPITDASPEPPISNFTQQKPTDMPPADTATRATVTLQRICLVGKKDGFEISIPIAGCILGREGEAGCDYFGRFDFVSRKHARIVLKDGAYNIIDDSSHNGTLLNNRAIDKGREYRLNDGDTLTIADAEFFVRHAR